MGLPEGHAPAEAAFGNGVLSHGAEMDDCHIPSITHAGSTSLPAVLAVAEHCGSSGSECLLAAAIAYELLPRVSFVAQGMFHEEGPSNNLHVRTLGQCPGRRQAHASQPSSAR